MALLLPVNLSFPPLPPPAASSGFSSFSRSLFLINHRIPVKSIPVLHSHSNVTFPFPGKVKPSSLNLTLFASRENLGIRTVYLTVLSLSVEVETIYKLNLVVLVLSGPQFEFREKARGCRLRITPRCSANSENEVSLRLILFGKTIGRVSFILFLVIL